MYVLLLVLMSSNGSLATTTAEFDNKSACLNAVGTLQDKFHYASLGKSPVFSYTCVSKQTGKEKVDEK
ncbi:hypothetical protein ACVWV0_000592 [Ewingella americana]|jgi:hypothetical protein